jgi:hypothetical protein
MAPGWPFFQELPSSLVFLLLILLGWEKCLDPRMSQGEKRLADRRNESDEFLLRICSQDDFCESMGGRNRC